MGALGLYWLLGVQGCFATSRICLAVWRCRDLTIICGFKEVRVPRCGALNGPYEWIHASGGPC